MLTTKFWNRFIFHASVFIVVMLEFFPDVFLILSLASKFWIESLHDLISLFNSFGGLLWRLWALGNFSSLAILKCHWHFVEILSSRNEYNNYRLLFKGSFTNYIYIFFAFFPYSCKHSLWTAPKPSDSATLDCAKEFLTSPPIVYTWLNQI